jgi:hypothetical protein
MTDTTGSDSTHVHDAVPRYDDVNVPFIVVLGISSAIITYVSIVFVQGLYYHWNHEQMKIKEFSRPIAAAEVIKQQRESLDHYLKADTGEFKRSMPIQEAMTLVLDEYKNEAKEQAAEAPVSPPEKIGHTSESGINNEVTNNAASGEKDSDHAESAALEKETKE